VNCTSCQTLSKLRLDELDSQYQRISLLLWKIIESQKHEQMLRFFVFSYKAIFFKGNNDHKEAVSTMSFIKTMLNLIQRTLHDKLSDQMLVYSWRELLESTAGKPDPCQMFLNCSGVKLFLDSLKAFPGDKILHCNMLGLLCNVAEVKELRPQLLTSQFLTIVSNLLESKADGIEVSYNACGVLSHIMFDGPDVWTVENPNRETVMDKMWDAIQSWDVTSHRNIESRSFESILHLLPQTVSPVSQHWAMWSIYRLVFVNSNKYCPLLVKEGRIAFLERLLKLESSHQDTKTMARQVMEQCENFKEDLMDTS
ncbi:protein zer-1, partial [Clarias magur]